MLFMGKGEAHCIYMNPVLYFSMMEISAAYFNYSYYSGPISDPEKKLIMQLECFSTEKVSRTVI